MKRPCSTLRAFDHMRRARELSVKTRKGGTHDVRALQARLRRSRPHRSDDARRAHRDGRTAVADGPPRDAPTTEADDRAQARPRTPRRGGRRPRRGRHPPAHAARATRPAPGPAPCAPATHLHTARARQREEFGGINWGAAFFGWLVAVGLGVAARRDPRRRRRRRRPHRRTSRDRRDEQRRDDRPRRRDRAARRADDRLLLRRLRRRADVALRRRPPGLRRLAVRHRRDDRARASPP